MRRIISLAVGCLVATGCGAPTPGAVPGGNPIAVAPQIPGQAEPWRPHGEDLSDEEPIQRTTNNRVRLLVDGPEIFPVMERMIQGAQSRIEIDYFIMQGKQGRRLANALSAKAKAGVHVDVMFDPGRGFTPSFVKAQDQIIASLTKAGVHVTGFPLGKLPKRAAINKVVDHDKVLVVDRRDALVGGMNIADMFTLNHDVMLQVQGPAAADMGRFLADDRKSALPLTVKAGSPVITVPGSDAPLPDVAPPMPGEEVPIRVLPTGIGRTGYKEALLANIRGAKQSVHALMFQLTDDDVVAALMDASRRKVEVRVILDPGIHDDLIPVIKMAPRGFPNLPVALQLQKAGVEVRWYRLTEGQSEMHAKVGIFDGRILMAGSTNWIPSAFLYNNEMSIQVEGGTAPTRADQMFASDWNTHSEPIKDKGVTQNVLSWIIEHIPYL